MYSLFGLAPFQVFNSHYRYNIFSSLQKVLFDSVVYSEIYMYILSYLPMESYIYFCKIKTFYNFLQNTEMENCSFKGVSLPLSFLPPPIFLYILSASRCKAFSFIYFPSSPLLGIWFLGRMCSETGINSQEERWVEECG